MPTGGPMSLCWLAANFVLVNTNSFFTLAITSPAKVILLLKLVSSIVSPSASELLTRTQPTTFPYSSHPGPTAHTVGVNVSGSCIDLARTVMQRIGALGKISDDTNCLTRIFCSPAMRRANALVASWMREAGMRVHTDPIGNLIGHFPNTSLRSKIKNQKSK